MVGCSPLVLIGKLEKRVKRRVVIPGLNVVRANTFLSLGSKIFLLHLKRGESPKIHIEMLLHARP